jgi:hypothetical protein
MENIRKAEGLQKGTIDYKKNFSSPGNDVWTWDDRSIQGLL